MRIISLAVAGLALAVGTQAHAQQAQRATINMGNGYIGVQGGVVVPDDIHVNVSGTSGGVAVTGSGDFSFDAGGAATVFAGYHINNWLAAEGELGWVGYDYDALNGTITAGGTSSGKININGDVTAWVGFVNAIIAPWGRDGFSPYVGGGIGFANYDNKINTISNAAFGTLAVNSSQSTTDFAANVILGFDYPVSDAFSLGARYRFVWINSGTTQTGGGLVGKTDDATLHVFTVNASYHF